MKNCVLLWFLLVVFALPAHADQWTIQETETAIVAEHIGDANDNPTEIKAEEQPASQTTAQTVETPDAGVSEQAADERNNEHSSVRARRTEQDEARRRLKSEKRAARKGGRQSGTEHE